MAHCLLEALPGFGVDFTKSFFGLTWVTVVGGVAVLSLLRGQWRLVGTGPDGERRVCDVVGVVAGLALLTCLPDPLALGAYVFSQKHGRVTKANRATVQLIWGRSYA